MVFRSGLNVEIARNTVDQEEACEETSCVIKRGGGGGGEGVSGIEVVCLG